MPKLYWYFALVMTGALMIIFTAIKKKKNIADMFSFFVFVTGLSWVLEVFILLVFNAYDYKPGIFNDPAAENIIGHLIANTALWSSTAILVMYFQLPIPWLCLISVVFMVVEELFLKVHAYEQNWWRTYMTGIGVFLFMWGVKKWYSKFYTSRNKFMRNFMSWLIAWVLITATTSALILSGKVTFDVGWSRNTYWMSVAFCALLYNVVAATAFTLLKRHYWYPLILMISTDLLLDYFQILKVSI